MLERKGEFILNILQDLDKDSMKTFLFHLNRKEIDGKTIPKALLEDATAVKVATLFESFYYPQHLEVLHDMLLAVPNRQLANKVSFAIETEKKRENEIEEMDGIPAKKAKYSEVPQYKGDYRFTDMEDYATKNQDLLIERLKEYMEPSAFKTLEEELAMRKLKNVFSFKAAQFHSLVTNQKLKGFLRKDWEKPSHRMPSKILNLLFFPYQSNNTQQMNQPRKKKPITSSLNSRGEQKLSNEREDLPTDKVKEKPDIDCDEEGEGDERKELPENKQKGNAQLSKQDTFTKELDINCDEDGEGDESKELPENKQKGDPQISKQDNFNKELDINCDEDGEGDESKELPENKQKGDPQISKQDNFTEESDVDYDGEEGEKKEEQRNDVRVKMEPVHESKKDTTGYDKPKKEVSENEPYENLRRAIRKHYEGKMCCIKMWCNREHEIYKCFIAQDVILFKFEEETEYRILQNLHDDQDLNRNGLLKKNVEFELQFNMAVFNVQHSECISINNLKRVEANSFRQYEEHFEKIVSVIVLPVLALYKKAKLKRYFTELGVANDNPAHPNPYTNGFPFTDKKSYNNEN